MAVNLEAPGPGALLPVAGVELGVAQAGIRKAGRDDTMVMRLAPGARAAGVFTRNRFCAAPVVVCREHLAASGGRIRALVVNTGNANAGTGARGVADARHTCRELAGRLGVTPAEVLPFSTGVILEPLPVERLDVALAPAIADLAPGNWARAAAAIMTTDTVPKAASRQGRTAGGAFAVSGITKGAGMIRPNMATMLAFVATDATIAPALLEQWVREVADESFNRITVDGDTSTNDSFILVASGAGELVIDDARSPGATELRAAIGEVATTLAQAIVRDGEGATKFITVRVEGAGTTDEASAVAYAIAHSPLVKTAFFASDPNLGRLLCAIGYAGVPELDVERVDVWLDDVHVATAGALHPEYREADGQRVMRQPEITVRVDLGRGAADTTIWTCDLSHDYVSINADYRS